MILSKLSCYTNRNISWVRCMHCQLELQRQNCLNSLKAYIACKYAFVAHNTLYSTMHAHASTALEIAEMHMLKKGEGDL